MSYEPGTYINLSYLNKPKAAVSQVEQVFQNLYEPGTKVIFFDWIPGIQTVSVAT